MRLYLTEQQEQFASHLKSLREKSVRPYDTSALKEKSSIITINTTKPLSTLDLSCLQQYNIFPSWLLSHYTQWEHEHREMKPGDTIVQQIYMPPLGSFSQKIIVGVRIKEVIEQSTRRGFSYETLEGHVEKGLAEFTVEEIKGELIFRIKTFSAPGNAVMNFFSAIVTVPYQTFCTQRALQYVKKKIEAANEARS